MQLFCFKYSILFVLITLLFSTVTAKLVDCPIYCRCSHSNGIVKRVDCSTLRLNHIPAGIPTTARVLDLRQNYFAAFNFSKLSHLTELHTLFLTDNHIKHLDKYALDVLPKLRRLYLGRNRLRNLPQLSKTGKSQLQSIDLHANHLKRLSPFAFTTMRVLKNIDLAFNFLQNLPANLTVECSDLRSLHLEHNPWNCDCRIAPTIALLQADLELTMRHHPNQTKSKIVEHLSFLGKCQNPGHLRLKPIRHLNPDWVKCHSAIVNTKPDNSYLLVCNLSKEIMPPSANNIEWLNENKQLETSLKGEYEILKNGSLIVRNPHVDVYDLQCAQNYITSPLRQIRQTKYRQPYSNNYSENNKHLPADDLKAQKFKIGAFQQQLQHNNNKNDNTFTTQQLVINEVGLNAILPPNDRPSAPRFTYVLRDRSYREGSTVKLNCEVIGRPRPQFTWRFNVQGSNKSKIIEVSRKFQYRNDGTELLIYPFLEQDVGRYSCEAENKHGRVEAHASIGLVRSQPPVIIDGPKTLNVHVGQRAVFMCKSRGEPHPIIAWFFDGSEISITQNNNHYRISDDGSKLVIEQTVRADQGTYSCMAGNSVGSMTGDAQLRVEFSTLDAFDIKVNQDLLTKIVNEASTNVDRAIMATKNDLKHTVISSPHELLRHFKFTTKRPTELSKAREIYEESLRLLQRHVETGLHLQPIDLPTNISYESMLSVTHIQTIMELSGCMNGQFKESCNDISYTGQCNNFEHPTWGVSQMPFLRLLPPIYENGFNMPVGWDTNRLYFGFPKPNPRTVSMELIGTEEVTPHTKFSLMLMQWGQFMDHDIDFTATALARQTYSGGAICNRTCENIDPCFNIPLPLNDPRRKPGMKFPCIEFERSAAICGSGETSPIFHQITYREQTNTVTSFIDASNVYGSTEVDSVDLRDLYGDHGLLRFDIVSAQQKPYMPFEKDSAMDCRRNFTVDNPIRCFLSGDVRANEVISLTSMHTIWFREHNRIAAQMLEMNADWDGERIYQEARKIVGAMLQHITYAHWLPKVLGKDGYDFLIKKYKGYDSESNPLISNAFATAAFRFGHTLINPILHRFDENFETIAAGSLKLHDAFFAPERLLSEGGVDPILRGLFATPLKLPKPNQLLNKELTEKLFNRAHDVSLDLAVMNIQRGRDHGLPEYLAYRKFCNLTVPNSWEELAVDIKDANVLKKLKKLYGHPGNIDLFVGGVVERRLSGALVGPTFACIIADQFRRLRDGDRFWYENPGVFTQLQINQIKKATLAKTLCNNGDAIDRVQPDVFIFVGDGKNNSSARMRYKKCAEIPDMDLRMWMSCCDSACSDRGNVPLDEAALRVRRAHNLYAPSFETEKTAVKSKKKRVTKSDKERSVLIPIPLLRKEKKNDEDEGHCIDKSRIKANGEHWNSGKCTTCKCQNGLVWCNQMLHCYEEAN